MPVYMRIFVKKDNLYATAEKIKLLVEGKPLDYTVAFMKELYEVDDDIGKFDLEFLQKYEF